jgi:hypothetical protein
MAECDLELLPLQAHIAQLKQLLLSTDAQIPHIGLAPKERNRWVQQMLYSIFLNTYVFLCFLKILALSLVMGTKE